MPSIRFSHRVFLLPALAAVSFALLILVHRQTSARVAELVPAASVDRLHASTTVSIVAMIAISAVGMLALVALATQVIASTAGPLAQAARLADRLARGDLSATAPEDARPGAPEELKELLATLGNLVEYLRGMATAADPASAPTAAEAVHTDDQLGSAFARLVSAEARQRQLVQSVQAIVWRGDPRTLGFTFVNRHAQSLLGHSASHWTENPQFWRGLVDPADLPRVLTTLESAVRERSDREIEFRMRTADGRWLWLRAFARVVCDRDGVKELVGVMVDVTERKRFEIAVEQGARRLRDAERLAHVGSWEWDATSGTVAASEEACRIFGVESRPRITVQELLASVHPRDRQRVLEQIREAAGADIPTLVVEHRVLRSDGSLRSVKCVAQVDRDDRGRPAKIVGSVQDMTEIKEAVTALRDSEERYRALFESNPHPMWVYDRESLRFLAANDAAVRRYGYSREEFLDMTIEDIRPKEDRTAVRASAARAEGGLYQAGEWRHCAKDGSLLDVEITSHDVSFSGWPARLVLANDITERKRLEERLRQSQKMDAVGRLAGGVAHDFNNLLNVIIGYAEIVRRKLPAADAQHRNLDEILKAGDRAAALTRQLLAFSRKQVLQPRDMDVRLIVSDMEKMLRRLIGENIELRATLGRDVGLVRADPGQIEQVIMNLVVNARDAMPTGGTLTIEATNVDVRPAGQSAGSELAAGAYVLLSVTDTGHGMDPETQSRIFEPFFTTKEMGRGTGLGLSTVYGIVQQSGGHITVSSTLGLGTTFRVYLPQVSAPVAAAAEPVAVPAEPGAAETVLLVEDEPALREMVQELLEDAGYTVVSAEDGADALDKAATHAGPIHLLLTDVVMPGVTGRQLAEALHGSYPDLPVLYMSGYTQDAIGALGVLESGTHFLQKPFTADALLRKLRSVLEARTR